jgi:alkanesulfonate monooxygenase SsuD/methylene tetrahydromethanopterin reductase-like flavin-dependent oxidoreductase (luciferase family)
MEFTISFDLRAPAFGAARTDLYAAALDQCAWADALGFDFVGIGEHHGADDGYLPSPLVFAAAAAGRTQRIRLRPSVLLAPFYEPIKLAEDLAVLQILSNGRLVVGLGAGYRPSEFAMFGASRRGRRHAYEETISVLRAAWSGEPFSYRGRTIRVSPVPERPPPIWLGGAHPAVARRAAHIADHFFPPQGESWDHYRDECRELGRADPGPCMRLGPVYVHVTHDPERDWERIEPHVRHVVSSYSEWTREAYGRPAGPFADRIRPEELRATGAYQVVTPEGAIELVERLAPHAVFHLSPLLGGIDPAFAWQGLEVFEREVWPHVKHLQTAADPDSRVQADPDW